MLVDRNYNCKQFECVKENNLGEMNNVWESRHKKYVDIYRKFF